MNTSSKPSKLKKDTLTIRNVASGPVKAEHGFSQTVPNTYLTNIGDENKRYNVEDRKDIFPSEKESNFYNYNVFEFFWITPDKLFNVSIKMPLITLAIPKNNIIVKKYIDF